MLTTNFQRHVLLFAALFCTLQLAAYGQKSVHDINLDQLTEQDCIFLDSCIQVDKSMTNKEKVTYFTAMQIFYDEESKFYLALYCTDSLISLYQQMDMTQELADAYRDKSIFHDYVGQYLESMTASQKSLELYIKVGDKEGEANSYNDIGVLHYYSENFETARDYFDKALVIYEQLKDTAGITMYYNNVANTYFDQDNLEQSIIMYKNALKYDELMGDIEGQCIVLNNIGETYTLMGEYDQAEKILLETLVKAEQTEDPWLLTNPLMSLGELYSLTKEYHKAIKVLERNVKICEEISALPEQADNYELLYATHKANGNFEKALRYHELNRQLNDSILDLEKERQLNELEVKYQLKDKAKEIELITQEKELDHLAHIQEMDDARNKLYLTITGLVAFAIVLFFSLRNMIQKKRANEKLKEQNQVIQNKNEEIKSAYLQIEEKNSEIIDSINYAKRIQSAILPPNSRIEALIPDSFILYQPKDVVAGDFYWLEEKNNQILLAVADCTGHGVPGAMVSVVCNNGLNRSVREDMITDPGKILDRTRELVLQEFGKSEEKVTDGMDIALVSLERKNNQTASLQFAGAHNPLWIIRKGQKEIEEIKADKQPIGDFPNPKPYTTHSIELNKGDIFYIFTDGYADQFGGEKGKKLKTGNLKKLLSTIAHLNLADQKVKMEQFFLEWKGHLEQIDDVCFIAVRI